MTIKVIEVSCIEDLVEALHEVEQECAPREAQHGDPEHDAETCPWCQLTRLHIEMVELREERVRVMALAWALLRKLGPVTLTQDELTPPRAVLSIDNKQVAGGVRFTANQSAVQ